MANLDLADIAANRRIFHKRTANKNKLTNNLPCDRLNLSAPTKWIDMFVRNLVLLEPVNLVGQKQDKQP